GTLALLASAAGGDRFRAVFALGPVEDVAGYGPQNLTFNFRDTRELQMRAPIAWLHSVKGPTFVFEGTVDGNLDSLQNLQRASTNPALHFHPIPGGNHFSIIQPLTRLLADKAAHDDGPECNITVTDAEMNGLLKKR